MIELITRADDIGISKNINDGAFKGVNLGIVKNLSFLVQGQELLHAIELFQNNKNISSGVHLSLTSGKNLNITPVLPINEVPSLLDSNGYFFSSIDKLNANNPNLDEIIKELNAQIDKAESFRLKISHIDDHMCFHWIPGLKDRIIELSVKRKCIFAITVEDKYPDLEFSDEEYNDLEKYFIKKINDLKQGYFTFVGHPLIQNKLENQFVIEDSEENYWLNRMNQEQKLFSSNTFKDLIDKGKIKTIKYEEALL